MPMLLAGAVVSLAGAYLLAFGVLAVASPSRASAFLGGFAGSLRLHVLELLVRLVVGVAFVAYASHLRLGGVFHAFGWVLVVTTLALAAIPWRWHRRIADTSVPAVVRFLPWMGAAAVAAGALVLWAVAAGRG